MKDRLFIFRYEDLVISPEEKTKEICGFLKVVFDPTMLVPDHFRPISGEKWTVYSHYDEVPKNKIYTDSIDIWKKYLDKGTIEFIEFICDPEMRLFGYEPQEYLEEASSPEIMNFLIEDDKRAQGWRGDHESWDKELTHEIFRKQVLKTDENLITPAMAEQNYLFPEVLQGCRELELKPGYRHE